VGAHNRTASRSDTLFHHKLVVPTNLSTAVEQHTNWLPELANEARMAPAAGANQTIIHPSVARFPVPPPSKMGPVAACAACAPYRLESLSSWSFRSPYELHKHFSAELLQRQELADVLSPRRAHLLNSLDSQLLHSLCNWKTGPTAVPGKTAPRPSEAKNNGQPTLGLNVTGLGWRSGLRQREPALGLVRTLLEGRKTFLVRKRQRGTAVLVVRQHPDAVEGQQVQGPGTVVALAVLEDAVQGLANISTAPSIQAAVRGLIGDWFKLGGNVGVDPNLFKTRTLVRTRSHPAPHTLLVLRRAQAATSVRYERDAHIDDTYGACVRVAGALHVRERGATSGALHGRGRLERASGGLWHPGDCGRVSILGYAVSQLPRAGVPAIGDHGVGRGVG
jgi:hypothetical protein